jgi:hypothetical protein
MIVRGILGVLVGLGYGVLVGAVIFLLDRIFGDPGLDLMLDRDKIARALILLAMTVTGGAGALVGLVVGLSGIGKLRAALTGFCVGTLVLIVVLLKTWPQWTEPGNELLRFFSFLLLLFSVLITVLPIGLSATGVMASVVAGKIARD